MAIRLRDALVMLFFLGVSMFVFSFAGANDTMTVETDVYKFPEIVSIEVPDYFYFGNVTIGFATNPTSSDKIYINNTGTFNVSINVELVNSSDTVYSNLLFSKRLSGTGLNWTGINEFNYNLPWSGQLGKATSDYFYMKLDLTSMSNIPSDMIGHQGQIRFIAAKQ